MTSSTLEHVERATGWTVNHHAVLSSTQLEAARLRDEGAPPRLVVVADQQSQGRGRGGRTFRSPSGGLYATLLTAPRGMEGNADVVALAAVAASDALQDLGIARVALKWPNDILIGRKKVGGILLERSGNDERVLVGIGINVTTIPGSLEPHVAARTTAISHECGAAHIPTRDDVLIRLLRRFDTRQREIDLSPQGHDRMARAWRERMAFVGERIQCHVGGEAFEGDLIDLDLDRGLLIRGGNGAPTWYAAHLTTDLRPLD